MYQLNGVWDTVAKVGDFASSAEGSGIAMALVKSSEFKVVLDEVQNKAENAVVEQTKKNALMLLAVALAGGALGGTVFRGPTGSLIAGSIAALASYQIIKGGKRR